MAVLDLTLASGGTTYVCEGDYGDGDLLHLALAGSHVLTVDGVEIGLGRVAGQDARLTVVAGHGAAVNIDQSRLDSAALAEVTLRIDGKAEINLDGGDTALRAGILKTFRVAFAGTRTGAFIYNPPADNLPTATTFHVDDMQAGHHFNILAPLDGRQPPAPGELHLGAQAYDAATGYLHLAYRCGLAETHVHIRMTAAQAALLTADLAQPAAQRHYCRPALAGGRVAGYSIIFPGSHVCYAAGTLVQTISGYRPVESLRAGDLLICADGVARALLWQSASRLSAEMLDTRADMRPIRIRAGALAPGYPFGDLVVSPQLRIWVDGPAVRAVTGAAGGLIAARHLLGLPGIIAEDCSQGMVYHHLLLSGHEILVVNGIFSESTHPGVWTLPAGDAQALADLDAVLPLLQGRAGEGAVTRHPLLTGRSARQVSRLCGLRREMFFDNPGHYAMPARPPAQTAVFAAE